MKQVIGRFIPQHLSRSKDLNHRRAELAVALAFGLAIVSPFLALVAYARSGSVTLLISILFLGFFNLIIPPLLRGTGSIKFAGTAILLPAMIIVPWISTQMGGLNATSFSALAVIPLMASVFQGLRAALIWLGLVLLIWAGFLFAHLAGVEFTYRMGEEGISEIARFVELLIIGGVGLGVIAVKEGLQTWLVTRIRAQEAQMRAIFETAPDGILTIDRRGRVLSLNPTARKIFGIPEHEEVESVLSLLPNSAV